MSDKDLDRNLPDWLDAMEPRTVPTQILDKVFAVTRRTDQRRGLADRIAGRLGLDQSLRRRSPMNRMLLAVGGVAALVALTLVGAGLLMGLNSGSPGVGALPSPTPTAVSSATPTVTVSPTASARALRVGEAEVDPGTYFAPYQGYRYSFNVTGTGWTSSLSEGGIEIRKGDDENGLPAYGGLFIWGLTGPQATVFSEACDWRGSAITPGPTAADLATALAALDGFDASEPADTTVSGYQGKRLQLTVPDDVDFADCDDGAYYSIDGRFYQGPGQIDDIRILDLDGTRHYLYASYHPATPPEILSELEQVVESLEIERIGD
jgi:hypothetical protein